MPLKVLKRHGVIESDGQLVSLSASKLTLEQRAHVRMLCEQRLQSLVQKRGIGRKQSVIEITGSTREQFSRC